jgi:CubicO group peptidase (beta-lactamase class C family)
MKARLVALALLLLLPSAAQATAGRDGPAAVDRAARRLNGFSGAILVGHHGRIALLRGYGGTPAGALFDIGSVAKTFTAAAVLRLEQDRRLRLDAPISRYLPHVPARRRHVTIRQLLTHTGGLPQAFDSDLERVGRAEAVRRILAAPGPPAGRFAYSNAGYTLLAAIVERVSQMPFRRYVRSRLLLPGGMRSTGWLDSPLPGLARARAFARGRSRGRAGSQVPLSWSILGAGGMLSNARDLFRWSVALATNHVLSAKERAEYRRGYVPLPGLAGARASYAWIIGTSPRRTRVVLIGGETDYGFTADFRRFVDEQTTIVTLSATDRAPAGRVAARVEHAYFGKA